MSDQGLPEQGASPLAIGEVIAGKYRIERQIGTGGMGVVLAATHLQLEQLVAIKVMRRDALENEQAVDRLLLEARAAAKIRSEHVARVFDVGTLDNGSPFIVFEYLEGEDLGELLDREGPLPIEIAVAFILQACEALAEVHVAEMVHRDLKPGNLFIAQLPDGSPTIKIVDFGISKQIGHTGGDRAEPVDPQVLGSPFYMAPEQMLADPVDERSDIWALGAILFEMLTGRTPFVGETLPDVYSAVLDGTPPSVESLRPNVPAGLDDVVQRCLEKDPAQRFCDVADLAEALAPFGDPGAAISVDRITRILTNTEPVRGRISFIPVAPVTSAGAAGELTRTMLLSPTPPIALTAATSVAKSAAGGRARQALRAVHAERNEASVLVGDVTALSASRGRASERQPRRGRSMWASVAALSCLLVGAAMAAHSGWQPLRSAPAALVPPPSREVVAALPAPPPTEENAASAATDPMPPAALPTQLLLQAERPVAKANESAAGATPAVAVAPKDEPARPATPLGSAEASARLRKATAPVARQLEEREPSGAAPEAGAPASEEEPEVSEALPVAAASPEAPSSTSRPESDRVREQELTFPESMRDAAAVQVEIPRMTDPWNPSSFGERR